MSESSVKAKRKTKARKLSPAQQALMARIEHFPGFAQGYAAAKRG